jgi:hypothetical protein
MHPKPATIVPRNSSAFLLSAFGQASLISGVG